MTQPFRAITYPFRRCWRWARAWHKRHWENRRHRCTRCWYDMVGTVGDVCPECGTPKSRADSILTDGRWHLRVGIYVALISAVLVLLAKVALVLLMTGIYAVVSEELFDNVLSRQSFDSFRHFRTIVVVLNALIDFWFIILILCLSGFLTLRYSTRFWHQEIRGLFPLGIVIIAWLVSQLLLDIEPRDYSL